MIVSLKNINYNNIIYGRKTQDKLTYYNIQYATPNYQLNNIYLKLNMSYTINEQSNNIFVNFSKNSKIIDKYVNIERELLLKSNIKKKPIYKLQYQLDKGYFNATAINKKHTQLYLKIGGIWENETEYGLIYRFYI